MGFDYQKYFRLITPRKKMDIYNRFIFAFTSIHTTWQSNIKGYLLLKDKYHQNIDEVKELVIKARLGLNNSRSKSIIKFTEMFIEDWTQFKKRPDESWDRYANRLQDSIYGLGYAKTRFAIELLYPNEANVICPDTHIIQWAKQNPNKVTKRLYKSIEKGFKNHAKNKGLSPVEARWRWWDTKQGYDNPRYWSWVIEQ